MRLLVTGGAGFIGSYFVRAALRDELPGLDGCSVTVLDKLTYCGNMENLAGLRENPRLRFVHGDICDAAIVEAVMAENDIVVHLAAETHVDRSIADGRAFVMTNVVGTEVLLAAALRHQVHKFVHVSTDEVYGSIDIGSWDESCPVAPNSPYAASKASSDLLALAYHRTHQLPVVVTRCSNNYGPYQYPEKLIPRFVTSLLDGGEVPLYGDGGNVRDWLHVSDHGRAIALAAVQGRPGEVYNVGGGLELSNKELTAQLLEACGRDWNSVRYVDDRLGHDRRYSVDHQKLSTELGYRPRVAFTDGIADTVPWYRDHRDWWEPLARRARR